MACPEMYVLTDDRAVPNKTIATRWVIWALQHLDSGVTQHQTFMEKSANTLPFITRFMKYQTERFPFAVNSVLIACLCFSAISYSRICRGVPGFIPGFHFLIVVCTTILLFFLLRVLDEFKDGVYDVKYRKHLPVPRGLVSLHELGMTGLIIGGFQVAINGYFLSKMLILYFIAIGYMLLMGKEFFVSVWLTKHPFWYVASHMFIIPLMALYASGADWLMAGISIPKGIGLFFLASYANGVVIEIGRKIKDPSNEEQNTYSTMLGTTKATRLWLVILFGALLCNLSAAWYAGYGILAVAILVTVYFVCSLFGFQFMRQPTENKSKWLEKASGIWSLCMYLTLGGIPLLSW